MTKLNSVIFVSHISVKVLTATHFNQQLAKLQLRSGGVMSYTVTVKPQALRLHLSLKHYK